MAIPGAYGCIVIYVRQGVVGAGAALERGGALGSASFIADKVGKGRDSSCCSRFVGGRVQYSARVRQKFLTPSSHSALDYISIIPSFCHVGYFSIVLRSCFPLPVGIYDVSFWKLMTPSQNTTMYMLTDCR